jgi:Ser-tRNA(Ala) deacylase AlaX
MTQKIFWQDPYLAELDTHVSEAEGDTITLASTIFYAETGGQESDTGTIGGHPVLAARKEGQEIFYTLPAGHGLQAGDPVKVLIDWQRRYRLMRLHFAAEIVLELVYQNIGDLERTGAHISTDKARLDFIWEQNISSAFPMLLEKAQTLIAADHPITSAFSDPANERRYWAIDGFSRVDCAGTHLRRTGEVGEIKLKRKNPGKGKERIEIYLA